MPQPDHDFGDPDGRRGETRRPGASPAWLLLPVLSLVVGVIYVKAFSPGQGRGERPAPPIDGPQEIVAWSGHARHDGLIYQARLAPLHADAERLAFDRERLARRLSAGEGGPWRLEVRLDADPEAPAPAAGAGIDLGGLGVRDAAGAELRPPVDAAQPRDDAPSDPLATLLSPSTARLAPGEGSVLVLWGERPGPGASVSGLPVDLQLEETSVPASVTERPLQHIDVSGGER